MEFIIVKDLEQLKRYKQRWDEILLKNNNNNPFIEYEWIRYWWKYLGSGHELFIIVIIRESEIIGFCPLMLTKKLICTEVNFIGYFNICYMDFIILNYYRKDTIEELMNFLIGINKNYIFNLHGLAENSVDFRTLQNYFIKRRLGLIVCALQSRYIDTSSGDFDRFYKERCIHRFIKGIARNEKKLKKIGKLTYKRLDENNIDSIYIIHNKRWKKKNDSSSFSKGETKKLFRQLTVDTNLPFDVKADGLFLDDRLIAFKYGFIFNKRLISQRVAHDDCFAIYAPGKIIYKEKIKECFEKVIDFCEFGTGFFQQDKAWWTDCVENINRVVFPSKNIVSNFVIYIYIVQESLRSTLRKSKKIMYFKTHTLGIVKYIISKCTFSSFKETILGNLNIGYLRKLITRYFKYYYYHKKIMRFDVYHKTIPDMPLEDNKQCYELAYTNINELEDIVEIMQLKSDEILRRLEKDNRCIKLMKGSKVLAWSWIDEIKLSTRTIQGIKIMENDSVCIYDNWMTFNSKDLNKYKEVIEGYCNLFKSIDKKSIYIIIEKHEKLLIKSVNEIGFKKNVSFEMNNSSIGKYKIKKKDIV